MDTVVEVVGVNGDVVVLAGEETGVDGIWLSSDLKGFLDPEVEVNARQIGNRPGSELVSYRFLERHITFNVAIANDEGIGNTWRERDSRWRRLWDYEEYSKIRVTTDEGQRYISVRLSTIEVDTTYDPHVNEVTTVTMEVVADDPFWYAPELVREVVVTPGQEMSITVLDANPGDVPVYPEWVLEAPGTWAIPDYDLKAGDYRTIRLPSLADGEDLVVNTDPGSRQLTTPADVSIWARMNGVRFAQPIPKFYGKAVFKVLLEADGPRSCQLRIKRPFTRPWGLG